MKDFLGYCIYLTFYDMMQKKKYYLRLFFYIFVIAWMFTLWGSISISLDRAHQELFYGDVSVNTVGCYFWEEFDQNCEEQQNIEKWLAQNTEQGRTGKVSVYSDVNLPELLGCDDQYLFIPVHQTSLLTNEWHEGKKSYVDSETDQQKREVQSFGLRILYRGQVFNENEYTEYAYGNQNPVPEGIKYGKSILNPGDIIVSDYMLSLFGIEGGDSLVGSLISFRFGDELFIRDYKLVGISDREMYRVSSLEKIKAPQIVLCPREEDHFHTEEVVYEAAVLDLRNNRTLMEEADDAGVFLNIAPSNTGYENMMIMRSINDRIVLILSVLFSLVMILSLINLILRDGEKRKSYQGILMINGVHRIAPVVIAVTQIALVTTLASVAATLLNYFLSRYMLFYFSDTLELNLNYDIGSFLIMSFLVSLSVMLFVGLIRGIVIFGNTRKPIPTLL